MGHRTFLERTQMWLRGKWDMKGWGCLGPGGMHGRSWVLEVVRGADGVGHRGDDGVEDAVDDEAAPGNQLLGARNPGSHFKL
ncbi:hypothetical protein [Streptomyces graminofaciens]|nr:hypothetical protein [Streptomyces graminofaciens]